MNKLIALLFSVFILPSCAPVQEIKAGQTACSASDDKRSLAGAWLYEQQGYISTLLLDEQGNGSDEWKNIQVSSDCLVKQLWRGVWRANGKDDRFNIGLSSDLKEGKGHWLDSNGKPKGEFQVKRIN